MPDDLWRIDDGGERDDAPPGEGRSAWVLASWSGDRRHEIEVVWSQELEDPELAELAGRGVADALAGPPGRRGLAAVLAYLPAENPPARVALTLDGLHTEPRWIPLGGARRAEPLQGTGWSWELQGPTGPTTVHVIEDPALGKGRGLPKSVRDARSSKGRSALAPLLDRARLPERIRVDADGVHPESSGS